MDLLLQEDTQQNISRISSCHAAFATGIASLPHIKQVRQQGTILAIEFETDGTSYFSNLRDTLYNYGLEQGVILRPLGNIIYLIPPYCITNEQLDQVYQTIQGMQQLIQGIVS
jgi:adenosylmethionine-8-amino-7-oxononanoate aminotransferase